MKNDIKRWIQIVEAAPSHRLTPTEKSYLSMWSGDHFLRLNAALRSGDAPDAFARALDSAIAKYILPTGTVIYREIDRYTFKRVYGADVNASQVIIDHGFMATSRNPLGSFGKVILRIETSPGQHGLDMVLLSDNPLEQEVLLPRGQRLRVVSIKRTRTPLENVQINVHTL